MKRFENTTFDYLDDRSSGREFFDYEFINCTFIGCGFSKINFELSSSMNSVAFRSTARRMTFINSTVSGVAYVGPGIVQDSVFDGIKVLNHLQTTGTVFKHVTFTGPIDKLMITPYIDLLGEYPKLQRDFDEANKEYYKTIDWAFDISNASFKDCDIRGVPAHLIRRDPETQFILTREKAADGKWRKIDLSNTYWSTAIEFFLKDGYQNTVLVAPKRSRKFTTLLEGLIKLRNAGIVESN